MTDESPKSLDETAANIAQQLGETDRIAREQIRRIVERLGADAALAFLRETLEKVIVSPVVNGLHPDNRRAA